MDEYIYYVRDSENRPMVTVCLMKDSDGNHARGVAICVASRKPDRTNQSVGCTPMAGL